jgi:3-hydroxybutyryl-CoA dehydrogenase
VSTLMRADDIVDSVLGGYLRDADALVAAGLASPGDIDAAMRLGAGHRSGPFAARGLASIATPDEIGGEPFDGPTVVVGSGRMASGIVEAIARAGLPVVALARSQESAERMTQTIEGSLARAVSRGKLDEADAARARASFRATADESAASGAGVVIEAVVEDLDVKRALLAHLDEIWPDDVPLATNTSSFTVAETMAGIRSSRPTLALHFFNPAPAMRLVEVVAGPRADAATVGRATAWVRAIGKEPVRAPDERGFLVNRLLIPMLNDAVRVHEDGTPIADIDAAMTQHAGHPMGPFALMDMIGIDVMVAALDALAEGRDARIRPARTLRELLAAGRLGRKSGRGFSSEGHPA